MTDDKFDFRNGNRSLPEVDRLMQKLLAYPDSDYYESETDYPRMLPLRRWVREALHPTAQIFPGGTSQ